MQKISYRTKRMDEKTEKYQMEPLGFAMTVEDSEVAEKLALLEADEDVYDIEVCEA